MGRGRAPCCEKIGLKKGSWTPSEDMRLVAYIRRHGHVNWRALPKQAGLLRCGKSCRLRWINYLRPDIKRGNFTVEEEETIIKLHQLLGNKWSKIASRLPGRTDNEIKNVWNTHLKKRLSPDSTSSSSSSSSNSNSTSSDRRNADSDSSNEEIDVDPLSCPITTDHKVFSCSSSSSSDMTDHQPVHPLSESTNVVDDIDMGVPVGLDLDIWDDVFHHDSWLPLCDWEGQPPPPPEGGIEATTGGDDHGESERWIAYLERELGLWASGGDQE
ncbi:hypothetical protein QJS10_CPA09g00994 [Acorus calamus]|uniref:Uncharacterized protein n=1 Tax=Acorus calamus TaxID=4465 RepID=A0AAV9E6B5_ACOCL|nr:hypothetical protein QJS10_CPA09g00994 [Acorus calamus]